VAENAFAALDVAAAVPPPVVRVPGGRAPAAAARAKAEGAPPPPALRAPAPRAAAAKPWASRARAWLPGWPRSSATFLLGIAVAVLLMKSDGPLYQLTRALSAMAEVSEETADLVVAFLKSGGSLSSSAGSWAQSTLSTTKDLCGEMWSGIDIQNVTVIRESGTFLSDSPEVLREWLQTPEALLLMANSTDVLNVAAAGLTGVMTGLPVVTRDTVAMLSSRSYSATAVKVFRASYSSFGITWEWARASYSLAWANPLWDLLELDPGANLSVVEVTLSNYFRSLPEPPPTPPTTYTIKAPINAAIAWRVRRWARALWSWIPWSGTTYGLASEAAPYRHGA